MGTAALLSALGTEQGLLDQVDFYRLDAGHSLSVDQRSEFGQFLTPAPVAKFMASLAAPATDRIRLLDAGAGVGSLKAAYQIAPLLLDALRAY